MNKFLQVNALFVLMAMLLSACGPLVGMAGGLGAPTVEPTPRMGSYVAQVQSVQVRVTGSPQQVSAVIRGMFSESCATLGQTQVQYSAKVFQITVYAVSPIDRGCAPATDPYETTVPLDISGLPAGDYTVTANGVSASFTLKAGEPAPTVVPTAGPSQTPGAQGCTDAAAFVTDVSVPDNVEFSPGTPFTKTWRLRNTGTCTWSSDYLVHHVAGDDLTQQPSYYFLQAGQRVEPGQTVDVSVGMTAPVVTGYYTSYWGLKGRDGQLMPVSGGANGNSFFVKIRVSAPVGSSKIVDQSIEIVPEQGSGEACRAGATYLVHAHVSADGPLSALYEIDSTAGQISAGYFVDAASGSKLTTVEGAVNFDASLFAADGTHEITLPLRFVGPYPYPDNIQVNFWVDGGQWVSAKVNCP